MIRPFSTASSPWTMTYRIPLGGASDCQKYYTLICMKSSQIRKLQLVDVGFIDPIFLTYKPLMTAFVIHIENDSFLDIICL